MLLYLAALAVIRHTLINISVVFYVMGMFRFVAVCANILLIESIFFVVVIDCNWFPQKLSILTSLLI